VAATPNRILEQIAVVIQNQMQFHRPFTALVLHPIEHGQAQVSGVNYFFASVLPQLTMLPNC
jgi:hypothetical protein